MITVRHFVDATVLHDTSTRMNRWIGKSAVVTGASSGIGEAIAKSLVNAGMNVIGIARRVDRLEELSKELQSCTKGSFQYVRCDLCNEEDILKAFEYIEEKFGGVDVLINNAGTALKDTISEGKTETFRTLLDLNVLGPTICCREALKSMRKHKNEGHIINMNSILGLSIPLQLKDFNLYPATKFALRAMTETLTDEIQLNKDNIRVTSIHPGLVKTEILRHVGHGDEIFDHFPHLKSEQIADCVIFALSAPPGTQISQIVITPLHGKA
ncbi:hypothetical protein PV328_011942 [Microctonus aethiopoides]|uniref:Uncharacterized protein n=1 Tax=Microctonus aethiopoides TaxID=144406 RepID=A0AA39EUF1_9HYME|nr:hypothetical protein PV328_011942 [Microctonus aethiopoides]